MCKSTVLGFDIGSYYSKISIANLGKNVEIAKNCYNESLFLTYFSFWNTSNYTQEVNKKHWSIADVRECSWSFSDNNEHYHENFIKNISFLNISKNGLMKRESLAIYIKHLMNEFNKNISGITAVLAVDPFLSVQDRYMMREVFKMTGINLIKIIDSPTAIAYLFANNNINYYNKSTKNVMFIDIGETKTWISIFEFEMLHGKSNANQISISYDKNFGGNFIYKSLLNIIKEKQRINITHGTFDNLKNSARKIERFSDLNIELNQIKVHINETYVGRIINNFKDKIYRLYQDAINQSNLSEFQIDHIEMLGGTTKIPFVKNIINEIISIKKNNQTIDQENAIALGAGIVGSLMISSIKSNLDIKVNSFCNNNISIIHNNKIIPLFTPHNYMKDSYIYKYNLIDNNVIIINSNNPYCEIVRFNLNFQKLKNDSFVKIYFGFDEFTLPGIYNIFLDNIVFNNISFYSPNWTITKRMLNQSLAFIKRIEDISEERKKIHETLNYYKSYFYEFKELIAKNKTIQKVMNDKDIIDIPKMIDNSILWIDQSQNAHLITLKLIKNKFKYINKRIKKIKTRANELITAPKALIDLYNKIQEVNKSIHITWPQTCPWMTEKDKSNINDALKHALKYYFLYKNKNKNKKDTDDPEVLTKDIELQKYYLEITYNHTIINTKHPPTPTPMKTPNQYVKTYKSFEDYEKKRFIHDDL